MAEITLEKIPRKAREFYDKGMAAMERENLDYARDMFFSALDIEPGFLRARKFLRAGAMKKFKAAKGGSVTHVISTLSGVGGIISGNMALSKKPQEALKTAEKLLWTDPLNKVFVDLLVKAATACDLPEVAVQTLEIVREHQPKDVVIIEMLGNLYLETNQTREARDCFERLSKLKPNDMMAIQKLKDVTALDTMNKGGWGSSESFRDMLKDEKTAASLEQQSKAKKSDKDVVSLLPEAEAKFREQPDNLTYARSLSLLYRQSKRMDEAVEVLQKGLQAAGTNDPQIEQLISEINLDKLKMVVDAAEAAGDTAAAEVAQQEYYTAKLADAEERVHKYPNDLEFKYQLGVLYFDGERYNDGIGQFQAAQRNPKRRVSALYYLARCFRSKGQLDIALEQLEKAASELHSMDNMKKDILYETGMVCREMGEDKKAVEYFKEIYAVDIGYRDVADLIETAYKG